MLRIVVRFQPDRIVLSGSHARGEAGPDSDVDLLVIMPVEGSKRRKATDIDVALLIQRIPPTVPVNLNLNLNRILLLNRYTIEGRYPGDWEPLDRETVLHVEELTVAVP